MAEGGSWWPKTWHEAIPNTVWTILSLGFGLDFITNVIAGNFGHALVALLGLGGLIAVLVHRDQLKARLQAINPSWIVAVFSLFLLTLVLSPFIEQRRWPFSYPDPKLVAENQNLVGELASAKATAKQFYFAYNLRNGAKASNGERISCTFALALPQSTGKAFYTWTLVQPLLDLARWEMAQTNVPGPTSNIQFASGFTILSGTDNGNAFTCAVTLSRVLGETFSLPVSLRVNQVTPALIACKNECVELDFGD